ncbi:MAG: DUF1499 domain-containing protein [Proteobacteria bacterium]|nr:DUF1499 domain-containing protein [Pseudomonadota bacterium]MBI3498437.1 DUF1499 domain-containing protein [Pseudomonadota bacterium]
MSKTARVVLWLAWVAALVAVAAIPVADLGDRTGLWPQIPSMFVSFRVALVAAVASLMLGLAAAWLNRSAGFLSRRVLGALLPFIATVVLVGLILGRFDAAEAAIRIHDVTTDTENPPAFAALLAERQANGRNPSEYDPATASLQLRAYPTIKSVLLDRPVAEAFDRALAAAQAMGWTTAADKARFHIEATAITRWLKFKDDLVIRVSDAGAGKSRIDVRSASRIGRGDLGQNAERIRAYIARLRG